MLSKKEALEPVPMASNNDRIPLVDLPVDDNELDSLLQSTDVVLVTHIHRDHWDITAQQKIPGSKPILCQPADEHVIRDQGFTGVQKVEPELHWENIVIHRTGGQHGTGEIGKMMGIVSVNHCHQKRPDFKKAIAEHSLNGQVSIPDDGQWWEL